MARKSTAVVCLLGLLACSALAQAQAADSVKSDSRKMAVDKKAIENDNANINMESPRAATMQGRKANDDKVESLNRLPHHKKFKLEVVNPTTEIEGKKVGSNAVLRADLQHNGVVVANAVLTGTAKSVDTKTGSFELNAIMVVKGLGKYAGSTLVAAGDFDWNGATKTIAAPHDTLTIVGGSGMATGATGTIKLAGGQGAVKNIMLFDMTLPKGDRVLDLNSLGKAQAGEASLLVNAEQPSPLSLLFPINAEEGGAERKAGGDNLATELGTYLRKYTRIGAQVKLPVCKDAQFAVEKNPKIGSDAVLRGDMIGIDFVLTGVATDATKDLSVVGFNAIMVYSYELKNALFAVVAVGDIAWDFKTSKFVQGRDTLTIVGGSGPLAGIEGTITLEGEGKRYDMKFDFSLPTANLLALAAKGNEASVESRTRKNMRRREGATLDVVEPKFQFERPGKVGSSGVLSFDLKRDGVKVAEVVMTGPATEVEKNGSFGLNALMTIRGVGQYEGSTLIAAGDIDWNGRKDKIRKYADTLTIIGGNGVATGAQGTIVLAGGKNVKDTLSFAITLPK